MNRKELNWENLTDEEKQIKVAEIDGYKYGKGDMFNLYYAFLHEEKEMTRVPDYLYDLNAIHNIEIKMSQGMLQDYLSYLMPMMKESSNETNEQLWIERAIRANASQRAEAIVLMMNNIED